MLNKAKLVGRYRGLNGCTKKVAENAVESVLGIIETAVQDGEDVRIAGYFNGGVKAVRPRAARNPKNGEAVSVPAKEKYVLKAGSRLKWSEVI